MTWASFPNEQFFLEPGSDSPTWYESSAGAKRGFCGVCGSPMLFQSRSWPGEMHVARALFVDPLDREPDEHAFYESRVPWLDVNDELPKKFS